MTRSCPSIAASSTPAIGTITPESAKSSLNIFSQKSVLEFEPYIRLHMGELLRQWDKLTEGGKKGLSGNEGDGWFGKDELVWFDCLPCKELPILSRKGFSNAY
jgi:hypothetical protein